MKIRIGTRGSALALYQANHVRARLAALGHEIEIRSITTTGDVVLDRRLEPIGGKGAFLKEIEEAMLAGEIDLAVHSLKDVPVGLPPGLGLCAYLERADPRDAVLTRAGARLLDLRQGARVGTTSLRRQAQLRALRPDLDLVDLRGNVDTRIRRLRAGDFDAILLAMAGLVRLERAHEVSEALDPAVMLPAPGQGVIAIECRERDARVADCARQLNHPVTERTVAAERAFLRELGGGCNIPVGAHAVSVSDGVHLRALVARSDGSQILRFEGRGSAAEDLGRQAARDLIQRGARELLV